MHPVGESVRAAHERRGPCPTLEFNLCSAFAVYLDLLETLMSILSGATTSSECTCRIPQSDFCMDMGLSSEVVSYMSDALFDFVRVGYI